MKDADYKHRPLVALSTTGKLSPMPPRPPVEADQSPSASASKVPRPRISPRQPTDGDLLPRASWKTSVRNFLRGLGGKTP